MSFNFSRGHYDDQFIGYTVHDDDNNKCTVYMVTSNGLGSMVVDVKDIIQTNNQHLIIRFNETDSLNG
jgi:hypothetical protein